MTNLPSTKRPVEEASDSPAFSPEYLRRLENLAEQEKAKAGRLAARLRALGLDPDAIDD